MIRTPISKLGLSEIKDYNAEKIGAGDGLKIKDSFLAKLIELHFNSEPKHDDKSDPFSKEKRLLSTRM